jgi:hypothetical protein
MVGRSGGGIAEDEIFMELLARYKFDVIDFGVGDVPVGDQIMALDGARIILGAHGANLANIVYLEPRVSIIELSAVSLVLLLYNRNRQCNRAKLFRNNLRQIRPARPNQARSKTIAGDYRGGCRCRYLE